MNDPTPTQLRFPALAGFTVRADFDGGEVSSDFGALLLRGVDRQTGLSSSYIFGEDVGVFRSCKKC